MKDITLIAELAADLIVNEGMRKAKAICEACNRLDIILCDDLFDEVENTEELYFFS